MIEAVVFDVGRVLFQWQLSALFEKLIADPAELDFVLAEVITEQWHFEHDAGRPLAEMVPERKALFPAHAQLIEAYAARFNETIPGPVPGSLAIVEELHARDMPLYAITNFGSEFWDGFRPTQPVFDLFRKIVVSGKERLVKPDAAIFALAAERFGRPAAPPSLQVPAPPAAGRSRARRLARWRFFLFSARTSHMAVESAFAL